MGRYIVLKNPFGIFFYLILRNDISWSLLSKREKKQILDCNRTHNVTRDEYKNPEKYGAIRHPGGENWEHFQLKKNDHRGQPLNDLLIKSNPVSVLEIGPGAGFYTRMICEYPSVRHYTAIDIGQAFLDYLNPRLHILKKKKKFTYNLICGEVTREKVKMKYDLIILFSTVHHIPNRIDLFKKLNSMLLKNGSIFCFDPSHYLLRIAQLIKKYFFNRMYQKKYYLNENNLGTHHMCTYEEYKKIQKRIPDLKIKNVYYKLPQKISQYKWFVLLKRWFSVDIGILYEKIK